MYRMEKIAGYRDTIQVHLATDGQLLESSGGASCGCVLMYRNSRGFPATVPLTSFLRIALHNWLVFVVAQNLAQMGKDRQGKLRGKCTEEGCPCDEFEPAKSGVKCASCRHTPVKHCLLDTGAVESPAHVGMHALYCNYIPYIRVHCV